VVLRLGRIAVPPEPAPGRAGRRQPVVEARVGEVDDGHAARLEHPGDLVLGALVRGGAGVAEADDGVERGVGERQLVDAGPGEPEPVGEVCSEAGAELRECPGREVERDDLQARVLEQERRQVAVATAEVQDAQAAARGKPVKVEREQAERLLGGAPTGQRPPRGLQRPAPELVPPGRRFPLARGRAAVRQPVPLIAGVSSWCGADDTGRSAGRREHRACPETRRRPTIRPARRSPADRWD